MIKTGNFDMNIFYDYYSEFNDNALFKFSPNEFNMLFNKYINIIGIDNALNTIRNYYDNKFNIVTLLDTEGKLINVL